MTFKKSGTHVKIGLTCLIIITYGNAVDGTGKPLLASLFKLAKNVGGNNQASILGETSRNPVDMRGLENTQTDLMSKCPIGVNRGSQITVPSHPPQTKHVPSNIPSKPSHIFHDIGRTESSDHSQTDIRSPSISTEGIPDHKRPITIFSHTSQVETISTTNDNMNEFSNVHTNDLTVGKAKNLLASLLIGQGSVASVGPVLQPSVQRAEIPNRTSSQGTTQGQLTPVNQIKNDNIANKAAAHVQSLFNTKGSEGIQIPLSPEPHSMPKDASTGLPKTALKPSANRPDQNVAIQHESLPKVIDSQLPRGQILDSFNTDNLQIMPTNTGSLIAEAGSGLLIGEAQPNIQDIPVLPHHSVAASSQSQVGSSQDILLPIQFQDVNTDITSSPSNQNNNQQDTNNIPGNTGGADAHGRDMQIPIASEPLTVSVGIPVQTPNTEFIPSNNVPNQNVATQHGISATFTDIALPSSSIENINSNNQANQGTVTLNTRKHVGDSAGETFPISESVPNTGVQFQLSDINIQFGEQEIQPITSGINIVGMSPNPDSKSTQQSVPVSLQPHSIPKDVSTGLPNTVSNPSANRPDHHGAIQHEGIPKFTDIQINRGQISDNFNFDNLQVTSGNTGSHIAGASSGMLISEAQPGFQDINIPLEELGESSQTTQNNIQFEQNPSLSGNSFDNDIGVASKPVKADHQVVQAIPAEIASPLIIASTNPGIPQHSVAPSSPSQESSSQDILLPIQFQDVNTDITSSPSNQNNNQQDTNNIPGNTRGADAHVPSLFHEEPGQDTQIPIASEPHTISVGIPVQISNTEFIPSNNVPNQKVATQHGISATFTDIALPSTSVANINSNNQANQGTVTMNTGKHAGVSGGKIFPISESVPNTGVQFQLSDINIQFGEQEIQPITSGVNIVGMSPNPDSQGTQQFFPLDLTTLSANDVLIDQNNLQHGTDVFLDASSDSITPSVGVNPINIDKANSNNLAQTSEAHIQPLFNANGGMDVEIPALPKPHSISIDKSTGISSTAFHPSANGPGQIQFQDIHTDIISSPNNQNQRDTNNIPVQVQNSVSNPGDNVPSQNVVTHHKSNSPDISAASGVSVLGLNDVIIDQNSPQHNTNVFLETPSNNIALSVSVNPTNNFMHPSQMENTLINDINMNKLSNTGANDLTVGTAKNLLISLINGQGSMANVAPVLQPSERRAEVPNSNFDQSTTQGQLAPVDVPLQTNHNQMGPDGHGGMDIQPSLVPKAHDISTGKPTRFPNSAFSPSGNVPNENVVTQHESNSKFLDISVSSGIGLADSTGVLIDQNSHQHNSNVFLDAPLDDIKPSVGVNPNQPNSDNIAKTATANFFAEEAKPVHGNNIPGTSDMIAPHVSVNPVSVDKEDNRVNDKQAKDAAAHIRSLFGG